MHQWSVVVFIMVAVSAVSTCAMANGGCVGQGVSFTYSSQNPGGRVGKESADYYATITTYDKARDYALNKVDGQATHLRGAAAGKKGRVGPQADLIFSPDMLTVNGKVGNFTLTNIKCTATPDLPANAAQNGDPNAASSAPDDDTVGGRQDTGGRESGGGRHGAGKGGGTK